MNTAEQKCLLRTIVLAKRGGAGVLSNPHVGVVIVKRGKVIAEGWHKKFGGPHAEADALGKLPHGGAQGSTVYVNLEPCADWKGKKTSSCAKRLVHERVKTVVIGMRDPNPNVRGKGIAILERAGIQVIVSPPRAEIYDLNHDYLVRIANESNERPFVLMKTAMSVDGKIGTPKHRSIALSTPEDRRAVDRLRAECDAIMVGGTTLRNDKPRLTVKDPKLAQQRIAEGRDAQPFKVAITRGKLLVGRDRPKRYRVTSLKEAMAILSVRYGVRTLMLEGGGELNAAMLAAGFVDLVRVATAPIILGGRDSPTLVDGEGFSPQNPLRLTFLKREQLGLMDVAWYRPNT